jgi:hypothetical protein
MTRMAMDCGTPARIMLRAAVRLKSWKVLPEARLAVDPYETFTLLNDAVNGGETFAGKLALP